MLDLIYRLLRASQVDPNEEDQDVSSEAFPTSLEPLAARSLLTVSRLLCVSLLALGCGDKAAAGFEDCRRLEATGKLEQALDACAHAATEDARSKSGQSAAALAASLRTRLARAKADQDAKQGFALWDGEGVAKDQTAARKVFETTCAAGSSLGCGGLGITFLDGVNGTGKDYTKATSNLQPACDSKVPRACAALAFMHLRGLGRAKDEAGAAVLYRESCDGGEPRGCSSLGAMYLAGAGGLPKDQPQGVMFLKKGCDGNVPFACWGLSNAFYVGLGVAKSFDEVARYGKKACDLGDGNGCLRLAVAYEEGQGVERSKVVAFELAQKSCDLGTSAGCLLLASFYAAGEGTRRDNTKAASAYDTACNAGDGDGCYALATFTRRGWGTQANPFVADSLLKKACDLGNPTACRELHR